MDKATDPPEQGEASPEKRSYRGVAFVNAYAVTRHYGGPEEGGWWYNAGHPLASMPVPATFTPNHEPDEDGHCVGCHSDEGERLEHCRNTEWEADADAVEAARAYLHGAFADVKEGDIYSVLGGTDVQTSVEPHFAQYWPARRPHYE